MDSIVTKEQAKCHITSVMQEIVEDFMVALRPDDLPMSEKQLEDDFRNFSCGSLEADEDEIEAVPVPAPV